MTVDKIVAIIIARKGSQRIPDKNTRLICGKPLVEWTILQACCSRTVDATIVATDDERIAEIAERYGCKVRWREDAPDSEVGGEVIVATMNWWEESNAVAEAYLSVLPTSPMRVPDQFDRGVARYRMGDTENVIWAWLQKEVDTMHVIYKGDVPTYAIFCRFDKSWNFCQPFGGDTVCTSAVYRKAMSYVVDHEGKVSAWRGLYSIVPVERWQIYDIDIEGDIEEVESIMQRRILNRLGRACYERYREGH